MGERMSPETFDQAVATTRLKPATIEAARSVLVHGGTVRQAAEAAGKTPEWARAAVKRVERATREALNCPDSWEVVTVCLPPDQAESVRRTALWYACAQARA